MKCVKCGSDTFYWDTGLCSDCEHDFNERFHRIRQKYGAIISDAAKKRDKELAKLKAEFPGVHLYD